MSSASLWCPLGSPCHDPLWNLCGMMRCDAASLPLKACLLLMLLLPLLARTAVSRTAEPRNQLVTALPLSSPRAKGHSSHPPGLLSPFVKQQVTTPTFPPPTAVYFWRLFEQILPRHKKGSQTCQGSVMATRIIVIIPETEPRCGAGYGEQQGGIAGRALPGVTPENRASGGRSRESSIAWQLCQQARATGVLLMKPDICLGCSAQ